MDAGRFGVAKTAQDILCALAALDLSYKQQIPPEFVAIDPVNRGGEGGNAAEVLVLAGKIAHVGWMWQACDHATCVEAIPGDGALEAFDASLAAELNLPQPTLGSFRYGSLSCGHTNVGLRAVKAGIPSENERLSQNGCMSLSRLRARDIAHAEAVEKGLCWTVLKWQVRMLYPGVLPVLQGALNVAGQLQRKESEMQGLLSLHHLSSQYEASGQDIDWSAVKKNVLRTCPPFGDIIDDLIAFVATRAGGRDGKFLHFLNSFYRAFVNPSVPS